MEERRRIARPWLLAITGVAGAGLVLWSAVWVESFAAFRWVGPQTWFAPWAWLGLDFSYSYRAGALLFRGGDPYAQPFGDARGLYAYPPLTLALHLWAPLLSYPAAYAVQLLLSTGVFAWAAAWANRARQRLGQKSLPYPAILAAVLLSTPVLFAMERGQCDHLMLPLLLVAGWALAAPGLGRDALAGLAIGAAVWMKLYPLLTLPALLALRRARAAAFAAVAVGMLALLPHTGDALRNMKGSQHRHGEDVLAVLQWLRHPSFTPVASEGSLTTYAHSVTTAWPLLFGRTPLGSVPGLLGAGTLLALPLAWVSYAVWRAAEERRRAVAGVYLLWVTALATFLVPSSFDYNLVFLLLAALALWSRGDPPAVHLLLGLFVLFWQPFALPLPGGAVFALKVLGLLGAGASLTARLHNT